MQTWYTKFFRGLNQFGPIGLNDLKTCNNEQQLCLLCSFKTQEAMSDISTATAHLMLARETTKSLLLQMLNRPNIGVVTSTLTHAYVHSNGFGTESASEM